MRRRSRNIRHLIGGTFLLIASVALFTKILVPLEYTLLNIAGSVLLGYNQIPIPAPADSSADATLKDYEARIIGKRADEFQETFLISKPSPKGTTVLVGDILIGITSSDSGTFSKVEMITSPSFTIDGVFDRSGIPATFQGKGASILEAQIPRGSDVVMGDVAYYDKGLKLRIGTVVKIQDTPSNPFITIWVRHPTNITTLQKVELLR